MHYIKSFCHKLGRFGHKSFLHFMDARHINYGDIMNTFKKVTLLFVLFVIAACGGGGGGMGSDDPYTPPSTPSNPGMTAIDKTFVITVAQTQAYGGSGNKYYVDSEESPAISIEVGKRYAFDLSDSSTSTHPFRISNANESGMTYGELVGTQGTPGAVYIFDATNANAGVMLYYWCNAHSGMGNVMNLTN